MSFNAKNLLKLRESYPEITKLVSDGSTLTEIIQQQRQLKQQIVFTNGCFDILHPGHVIYLSQAKALGDILIVGVNSDASVQQLKGSQRPINSLRDRLQVLAALASIDYLIPFEESTPSELLKIVRPQIYVKGGDYTRETLPETPVVEKLGGIIKILPFVGSNSTTKIIAKIRNLESPN
ncbi:MAG: D-glycero-beta-D-manno-heptose 1-phosphate adenylyltransferase [Oscillatoria sp. PMC 1068.18]|nr:D-glycero-beta-D-manno-heptose 1-phosphate adenylyltransferase [Oscillatoria sp. PMC 1076.18]MEC4989345.1 D-glycero-beta-D-manno-heptose 1-phosphate adenylyltransferase [Oscillatoria sp. PMC 1068.18]